MMHAPGANRHARVRVHSLCIAALLVLGLLAPTRSWAGVLFDFEGPYLSDPGRTIKDHAMVFDGSVWHCYYIRGLQGSPGTSSEQELGHAISEDLRRWVVLDPALTTDVGAWDGRNVWAPQVIPAIDGNGWTMFYTGVQSNFLQRMGRAHSVDLWNWTKAGDNPLLAPDPDLYMWSPALPVPELSAFRDPYFFEYQGQYHVLNTALIQDSTITRGYRGAVHHAVSDDLVNWTDVGPLLVNNGTVGVWREIESVQLIERNGTWHLFFTYFGIVGVQWVSNASFDTGWNLANAVVIDNGIAPELTPLGNDRWLFTRHAPAQHYIQHPDAGEIFYTLRADTLTFGPNNAPVVIRDARFQQEWPEREGDAFLYAPTFGDNQLERGEPSSNLIGNGYLSSREFWQGPLSGFGGPGGTTGTAPTGRIRSKWFTIGPDDLEHRFLIGGNGDPGCRIELHERVSVGVDSFEVQLRRSVTAPYSLPMSPESWPVDDLRGATVRFEIVDESAAGWISVDHIAVIRDAEPTSSPATPVASGRLHSPVPNPFNPRTVLSFELDRPATAALEIFDARGRRVRAFGPTPREVGWHSVVWDGTDLRQRELASGVYFVRLSVDGTAVQTHKAVLAR